MQLDLIGPTERSALPDPNGVPWDTFNVSPARRTSSIKIEVTGMGTVNPSVHGGFKMIAAYTDNGRL